MCIRDSRISGSIEVYKQNTSSLLLSQTLPITSGIPNAIVRNIGKTENKGLEIFISTVNIQGRTKNDFTWTSDINFFLNRGEITQLANGASRDVANSWFVGEPIDVYYDFKRNGIWQNTSEDLSLIHISEPTRQAEISYAVFCLKKKKK